MTAHQPEPLTRGQRWTLVAAALCAAAAVLLAALPKDWIESAFGVEPDGGSGELELVPIVVLAVVAVSLVVRVALARRRSHDPAADAG
jgi:hypothetical protein